MKTKLLLIAWLCLFAMQALATSISFENHAVAINSSCCQEAEESVKNSCKGISWMVWMFMLPEKQM